MSKRDRNPDTGIILLAFITFVMIFALIGYFQGLEKGQSISAENYANSHKEYAADKIESTCIGLDVPLIGQCIQEAVESSVENQRA